MELANKGLEKACTDHPGLGAGVNTYRGQITYQAVAESQQRPWKPFHEIATDLAR
jgi:alanine dehydrogenase